MAGLSEPFIRGNGSSSSVGNESFDSSVSKFSSSRRDSKRVHSMIQISEELSFLPRLHVVIQIASLFALIALVGFVYTGLGNNAFFSVLFPQKLTDYGMVSVRRWARAPGVNYYAFPQVIDAGSHGSRLHFFSWGARIHDPDRPLSGPVTIPSSLFTIESSPGITVLSEGGPDQAGVLCIKPLMAKLMKELVRRGITNERSQWSTFPVFLKATAGT